MATIQRRLCVSSLMLMYLTVIDCRLLPGTSQARRPFQKKPPPVPVIPQDIMHKGKSLLDTFKIPNSEFCSEMILKPEDHYMVLPWWYNYCQDLKEKHSRGMHGNINYNSIHKYILAEVQLYKKRMTDKNYLMTDLEKEIIMMKKGPQ